MRIFILTSFVKDIINGIKTNQGIDLRIFVVYYIYKNFETHILQLNKRSFRHGKYESELGWL